MDVLMPHLILKIFVFVFGSMIGSFLNVVVHRMPKNISVVTPRSSCPACGHQIKWYENIPILSYLFLRGKCKSCGTKISIRYPLLELFMGVVALLLAPSAWTIDTIVMFLFYFSLAASFTAHFLIDIEHQILPDKINIFLLLLILPYSILNFPLLHWLAGGLIGFLGTLGITFLFYKLKGQIGLGGGDIKLYGILGVFLGPFEILNNIFLSCFLGAIVGMVLIAAKKMDRETPFAFGPFIIVVAVFQIYFPSLLKYLGPLYLN